MTMCTANHNVVYRGKLYSAGQSFAIDAKDAAEMERHGRIVASDPVEESVAPVKRSPGRPRKNPA